MKRLSASSQGNPSDFQQKRTLEEYRKLVAVNTKPSCYKPADLKRLEKKGGKKGCQA